MNKMFATKPRSRASIACTGCRRRRTKCILPPGNAICDRCASIGAVCVLRNDDERRRPPTRAQVQALRRRVVQLEQTLAREGIAVPGEDDDESGKKGGMATTTTTTQPTRALMAAAAAAAATYVMVMSEGQSNGQKDERGERDKTDEETRKTASP